MVGVVWNVYLRSRAGGSPSPRTAGVHPRGVLRRQPREFFAGATHNSVANAALIGSLAPFLIVPLGAKLFGEFFHPRALLFASRRSADWPGAPNAPPLGDARRGATCSGSWRCCCGSGSVVATRYFRRDMDVATFMATISPIAAVAVLPLAIANGDMFRLSGRGWAYTLVLDVAHWARRPRPLRVRPADDPDRDDRDRSGRSARARRRLVVPACWGRRSIPGRSWASRSSSAACSRSSSSTNGRPGPTRPERGEAVIAITRHRSGGAPADPLNPANDRPSPVRVGPVAVGDEVGGSFHAPTARARDRAPPDVAACGRERASASRAKTSTGASSSAGPVEDRRRGAPGIRDPSAASIAASRHRRARPVRHRRRRGARRSRLRVCSRPVIRPSARRTRPRFTRAKAASRKSPMVPPVDRASRVADPGRSRRPGTVPGRGSRPGTPRSAGSRAAATSAARPMCPTARRTGPCKLGLAYRASPHRGRAATGRPPPLASAETSPAPSTLRVASPAEIAALAANSELAAWSHGLSSVS